MYLAKLSDVDDGSRDHDRAAPTGCGTDDRENHPCNAHVSTDQTHHGGVCVP